MPATRFTEVFKHIPITLSNWVRSSSLYFDAKPRVSLFLELGAVTIILVASFYAAFPTLHAMATHSLWLDEIYSVDRFSSKGPVNAITDYSQPNNHVFFNLLNSLSPWPNRFVPICGRFWSFAAVFGSLFITWHFFARRKLFLEGSLVIFGVLINQGLLDQVLQARGYGITLFCALLSALCCIRYFEKPSWTPIWYLSALTVVGTWTIPPFVIYGGGLMLFVLVVSKDLRWVTAGIAAILLIFILYSPILWQMSGWYDYFQRRERREYGSIASVAATFRTYVFCGRGTEWQLFLLLGFPITLFPLVVRPHSFDRAVMCLLLAGTGFFGASLYMERTFLRTTSFAIVGILCLYTLLISKILRGRIPSLARIFITCILPILALSFIWWLNGPRTLTVYENWIGAAQFIESNFRPGVGISGGVRTQLGLRSYLKPNYPVVSFDSARFSSGSLVHLGYPRFDEKAFPGSLPPGYKQQDFEQGRGKMILYYMPSALVGDSRPPGG